jgi:DNA-binding NarL/FixJ family response regulator
MRTRPIDAPRIRILNTDPTTFELLHEWLSRDGLQVIREGPQEAACELVLVDIAYPREHGSEMLERIGRAHPDTPILALSSGFFSSVACSGECAARLGASAVLAKPVLRETLIEAVRKLLTDER